MPEVKRKANKSIPAWERARILVHMQEEERKRKLFQVEHKPRHKVTDPRAKNPSPLDMVSENRKRLAELRKRMESGQEAR